jgi:hypothetical protein
MKKIQLLTISQILVFGLLTIEKYVYEINLECSCFPDNGSRIHFLLLLIFLAIVILIIILSYRQKKWLFIAISILLTYANFKVLDIVENTYSHSRIIQRKNGKIIAHYFYNSSIKDTTNLKDIQITLTIYPDYYVIVKHEGPECGCIYSGSYSLNKNNIIFDEKFVENIGNVVKDNKFEIYHNQLRSSKDNNLYFTKWK